MAIIVDSFVQKVIKDRRIKYLLHFTDIANLDSILDKGLISVVKLNKSNIAYINTDIYRRDNNLDYLSCSVEFPNYMYLSKLIKTNGNRYIVLRLNVECIFNNEIIVHKSNPYLPRWGIANKFEDLFFDEYRSPLLPENYPTDPRAEIQIAGNIESNYIDAIFFSTNFCENQTILELKCKYPNYYFKEDDYYFMPRRDFAFWNKIRLQGIDIYKHNL